jgi:hypothetical protein
MSEEAKYGAQHLFRVEPGIAHDVALEHASIMLDGVRRLTMIGVMENDGSLVWAAHYLSAMAKALVDDAGLKMPRS